MGKSGFTVFMAVLSFGITDPQQLAFATGQCSLVTASITFDDILYYVSL
jgi:hypothetical protein